MNEDHPQDPLIGRTVADGRYQVLALLGVGGMGTVYRAIQHPLERQVALKLIHRELTMNPGIVARFNREMRVTASIEHPHTVRVYDVGEIDGQPFLAMEYLAGRSLRAVLDGSGALPSERLASIGVQIAKALRAAHQAGIVHRDLKPDNVLMVDGYGERDFVKVLDFGIARPLEQEAGFQTVAGAIVGTPTYMSPEQATGEAIDTRSDLYSLGVMLFEMATGAPPFTSRTTTALLLAHASEAPPSLDGYPGVPGALRGLIAGLLQKDPAARPGSADEVIDALAPFAAAEVGGAIGTGAAPPRSAARGVVAPEVAPKVVPKIGGTLVLDETAEAGGEAPSSAGASMPSLARGAASRGSRPGLAAAAGDDAGAESGTAAPRGSSARPAVVIVLGLLALAGAGAYGYRRWAAGPAIRGARADGGRGATDAAAAPEGGPVPADAEPLDPAVAARLQPQLQASGEPPWPAACRSRDAAGLRRLAELAAALVGPDAAEGTPGRATALEAIRGLPTASAERWIVEARATLSTDAEAAVRASTKAVDLCPSSPVAHNLLGNALQRLQRYDAAAEQYRAANGLSPAYLAPRFNQGLVALRRNDAAAALAAFEAVGRADADYPNLPLVRAEAHRRLGDATAATADLKEQVRRHPKVADGWLQLGRALGAGHDKKGAREAFCRAKALGSTAAEPLCRR